MIQLAHGNMPGHESERSRYLEHNNSPEDSRYVRYLDTFARSAILPFVPERGRVLDFGSGPEPVLASLLGAHGFDVSIYDPFFAPDTAVLRGSEERSGGAAGYDAVVLCEVIEHLFEPGRELQRLLDILTPGGHLILRTSVFRGTEPQEFLTWWYRNDRTHVWFLTPPTIAWLTSQFALSLVHHARGEEMVFRLPTVAP